ncbi:hypothetical protein [Natrinema halophilum]|uniref:hypothetical protein n=1 Tax=Natrinema halophilum TaxID=1699371 RepID=UPI001F3165E3|nr:hypothetical protein [Natrinema halophilum]UHQ96354.1 hypothetical protein HYG82_22110 [Natrinema halophilum]
MPLLEGDLVRYGRRPRTRTVSLSLGTNDYKFHAIDAATGTELWNYSTQTNVRAGVFDLERHGERNDGFAITNLD